MSYVPKLFSYLGSAQEFPDQMLIIAVETLVSILTREKLKLITGFEPTFLRFRNVRRIYSTKIIGGFETVRF